MRHVERTHVKESQFEKDKIDFRIEGFIENKELLYNNKTNHLENVTHVSVQIPNNIISKNV